MDRDRFKQRRIVRPQPRSINGEERPVVGAAPANPAPSVPIPASSVSPTVITAPKQQVKPKTLSSNGLDKKIATTPPAVIKDKPIPVPALFDGEDDDDLFGVWATQKKLKKARQQKEAQERAAKLAAKMLKKEKKKIAKTTAKPHELAVSVSIPRINKFKKKHPKIFVGATAGVVVVVGLSAFALLHNKGTTPKVQTQVLGQAAVKPDFDTVYPGGTTAATALKYDPTKKVASYNDTINGTAITVSQQPLPSGFAADPASKLADLAKQINANDKISATDATAYAGVSIKGPQTVVFTKNDLLIFIIAEKKVETLDWIKYIDSIK